MQFSKIFGSGLKKCYGSIVATFILWTFLCIGTILPIFKESGNTPLIKHLLNRCSKTVAMTDADILMILLRISSGPALLLTFSYCM